jgi:hypothetical protein
MRTITNLMIAAAALVTAVVVHGPESRAGTVGNAPWCAVQNYGAGDIMWDCEFLSAEQCAPAVSAGNRGFCNLNPAWPQYSPVPPPVRHRKHPHS